MLTSRFLLLDGALKKTLKNYIYVFISKTLDINYTVAPAENDIPVPKCKILFLSLERVN